MAETTFTLRLDEDLKNRFVQAAAARDRSSSQLLREFMRRFAEQPEATPSYDEWFRDSVAAALADPRPAVPAATVERRMARLRARVSAAGAPRNAAAGSREPKRRKRARAR